MVSYNAEDSLIVVGCFLWVKFNNYSALRMRLNCSLDLRKREDIGSISEELESYWLVTVIADIKQSVCCRLKLYLTEVNA